MFFNDWLGLLRVLIVGTSAYCSLIVLLRISGNRTLSKMNAFDLVVTVALGSTLATILLTRDVALAEGVLAMALLVGLQFTITWLAVRSRFITSLIKSEPKLLLSRGQMLRGAMRRARVVESEIVQSIRESGVASIDEVFAVILETDGSFSVVSGTPGGPSESTLRNVERPVAS